MPKKKNPGNSQTPSTNRLFLVDLQNHVVMILDFLSTKMYLHHQSEKSQILFPFNGAISKTKSAFTFSTRLMLGFSETDRISSWRNLFASAKHAHSTMNLHGNDANVWHPHYHLGYTRSKNALIMCFVDLLTSLNEKMQPT